MQLLLIDGNHIMYSVLYRHIAKAKKRGDYEEATDRIVAKACAQYTTTIKKLVRRFRPSHMSVIFDNDGQNFRHRLSPIYKANRKERPKEVHPLKQEIYKRFREEGIPFYYATDYEGDDLIGTIAQRAEEMNRCQRVTLVSGDMDLAQLITPKTQLYLVNSGIFTGQWVTMRNMKSMFQVDPEQLPALKALLGDRTDNIKGVSGLRRPHALKVIERYPELNEFLDLEKGTNKTEALILKNRDHVRNNLLLAAIRCDLRFYLRWDDLKVSTWMELEPPRKTSRGPRGKAAEARDAAEDDLLDDVEEASLAESDREPGEEAGADEAPKPAKKRRKRSRKPKAKRDEAATGGEAAMNAPAPTPAAEPSDAESAATGEEGETKRSPRRRRRRRRPKQQNTQS